MVIMPQMLVGVGVNFAVVGVRMNMDQIVFLQEFCVSQELGWLAASYYPFITAKDMHDIRNFLNNMHIMRRCDYCFPVSVISVQKVDKIP